MKDTKRFSGIPDLVLRIHEEAKPDAGEDCYCYSFGDTAALLAVFDGCGGAGAQRQEAYSGRTEAYMASRFCAGAFYDSFQEVFPGRGTADSQRRRLISRVKERLSTTLSTYRPARTSSGGVKGSMVRTLPSTAAAVLLQPREDGSCDLTAVWAGDSRCYLLTDEGLAQLTQDDTTVPDPMENLYEDGVLKNVLCEGRPPLLHERTVTVRPPFVTLCATDGCFGYFSTPMEFEGALLQTMVAKPAPDQWEQLLSKVMGQVAGDDYTLCLAAYGFENYPELQRYFLPRTKTLTESCLAELRGLPLKLKERRLELWERYRPGYLRFLEDN